MMLSWISLPKLMIPLATQNMALLPMCGSSLNWLIIKVRS